MVMYNIKIRLSDVYLVAVGKKKDVVLLSEMGFGHESPDDCCSGCFSTMGKESDGRLHRHG